LLKRSTKFAQDEEINKLVMAENNDRRLLYTIAKESQTSFEEVGMGNAKYFQKA
jgi:hypothetical protein